MRERAWKPRNKKARMTCTANSKSTGIKIINRNVSMVDLLILENYIMNRGLCQSPMS